MSINIGIIGLGKIGKKRFELFQEIPDVGNISFFDPTLKVSFFFLYFFFFHKKTFPLFKYNISSIYN